MNIQPSFTNLRSYLSYQFAALRRRALRELLWAKLSGRKANLAVFPEEAPEKSPNRRFLSAQEIPVNQIIGTLNRQSDFDHRFRPLNKYLQDRWVNAYLALQSESWEPILAHKVGENYYVEDGHHRVSVAQALGLAFIQAKVWEYPYLAKGPTTCASDEAPDRGSIKVYVRATD
jgi:hypothetical protein